MKQTIINIILAGAIVWALMATLVIIKDIKEIKKTQSLLVKVELYLLEGLK